MPSRIPDATALRVSCLLLGAALAGCRAGHPAQPSPAAAAAVPVRFTDNAAASGLQHQWRIAGSRPLNILQTIGNGCAFLDYDGDGNLDVLLVGDQVALFRGDGHGRFVDVSAQTGMDRVRGHLLGCCVGDYDNDGWDDVYLSGYRAGVLLHNEGGRRFQDVTRAAGLKPQPWGTSCSFADLDGDGRLDLLVANYARFGPEPGIPQLCASHGMQTSCGPRYYTPLKPALYLNLGSGRFAEQTAARGVLSANGRGLGVAAAMLEEERRPFLALANDELPGDLLRPTPASQPLRYANVSALAGTAADRDGHVHGGMGTDWGDYDNDGRLDLFVSTFQGEAKPLYHNDGGRLFSDVSFATRVTTTLTPKVSFGAKFLDADNDGWLDLMVASGHVQDNIQQIDASATYRQTTALLRNAGGSAFTDVSAAAGPFFSRPIVGRGLAVGDYDNDGRVDALVVDSEGAPALLHNESAAGHWLLLRLEGVKSNRDGLGAVLTASAGGRTLTRQCQTDGSYLSASDRRVHFGLGPAATVDSLTVRWPSGRKDVYKNLKADQVLTLKEGAAQSLGSGGR